VHARDEYGFAPGARRGLKRRSCVLSQVFGLGCKRLIGHASCASCLLGKAARTSSDRCLAKSNYEFVSIANSLWLNSIFTITASMMIRFVCETSCLIVDRARPVRPCYTAAGRLRPDARVFQASPGLSHDFSGSGVPANREAAELACKVLARPPHRLAPGPA